MTSSCAYDPVPVAALDLVGFDFSHRLFRQAKVAAWRARRIAEGAPRGTVCSSERDQFALTVTLTAEAAHDWATWAALVSRVPVGVGANGRLHGLTARWRALPLVSRSVGRADDYVLGRVYETFLDDLEAWHGALRYGDPEGRWRVQKRLSSMGLIDGRQGESRAMSAELAAQTVTKASHLFEWAGFVTGLPTPGGPRPAVVTR